MVPVQQATSKLQRLLRCLLCLLVLSAAIDRLPDPPSIKTHVDFGNMLHFEGNHAAFGHTEGNFELTALNLCPGAHCFYVRRLSQHEKVPLRATVHLKQASDSSPPYSAL